MNAVLLMKADRHRERRHLSRRLPSLQQSYRQLSQTAATLRHRKNVSICQLFQLLNCNNLLTLLASSGAGSVRLPRRSIAAAALPQPWRRCPSAAASMLWSQEDRCKLVYHHIASCKCIPIKDDSRWKLSQELKRQIGCTLCKVHMCGNGQS